MEQQRYLQSPGCWTILLGIGLICAASNAATWHVATTGSDGSDGTPAKPFASVAKAQAMALPGDTVWIHGGTYKFAAASNSCGGSQTAVVDVIPLSKSGQKGKTINYFAFPGEKPVFDFQGVKDDCRIKGFTVSGNWIHMRGLEIMGVPQHNRLNHESWAVWVSGSFNTFELLNMHHNMGPGLFIQKGAGNLGLNCDSHHNWDSLTSNGSGQSADGFGVHVPAGDTGNVLRGCRAWMNTDDGYDLINAFEAVTIDHCIAAYSGYEPGTTISVPAGNGNGFKSGGYGADATKLPANAPRHRITFNLAFNCKVNGFYANHHPNSAYFYNNTAINNHVQFDMLGLKSDGSTTGLPITVGVYRNNIAYGGTIVADNKYNASDDINNSWNLSGTPMVSDFQSLDTAGVLGPRAPDGSIPFFKFAHLSASSKYKATGIDVGYGAKSDLGAFSSEGSTTIDGHGFSPSGVGLSIHRVSDRLVASFVLEQTGMVRLDVLDLSGRKLAGTRTEMLRAGPNAIVVPTVGSGVHFIRATLDGHVLGAVVTPPLD